MSAKVTPTMIPAVATTCDTTPGPAPRTRAVRPLARLAIWMLVSLCCGTGLVASSSSASDSRPTARSLTQDSSRRPCADASPLAALRNLAVAGYSGGSAPCQRRASTPGLPARVSGQAPSPHRLVSLNPSLTAIVLRLGAGDVLVGVDEYSARLMPELAALPRVGGLFDPGLESIVSLRPDRVLIVAGLDQQTHADRLEKLGLEVEIYPNERLDEVLENIERLGALLDRVPAARARIQAILAMRDAVSRAARNRDRPTTVAVVDRSPLFIVGEDTFLDEMLEAVGANNLGRQLAKGYPRGSIEWLISSRPELLLDMTPGATRAAAFWSRWPSIPAVENERVVDVDASRISLPGPDLDQALRELAVAVHGEEIEAAIDRSLDDIEARSSPGGVSVGQAEDRASPQRTTDGSRGESP